jgi:hypothetical protein
MTHLLPVPIPPRHSPACRTLSESSFALEPWDHRLPTSRFALLLRQPFASAEWGLSHAHPPVEGPAEPGPARPRRCLLHPWGTGLATQCRWLRPTTGRVCTAHPFGYPSAGRIRCAPRYQWSTIPESGDASLQKTTLPRALGCQLPSCDSTNVPVPPDATPMFHPGPTDVPGSHLGICSGFQPHCHPWPV